MLELLTLELLVEELAGLEEMLEAGRLTELAGFELMDELDDAGVSPQLARTPEAATIAAPFIKSRRETLFFIEIHTFF